MVHHHHWTSIRSWSPQHRRHNGKSIGRLLIQFDPTMQSCAVAVTFSILLEAQGRGGLLYSCPYSLVPPRLACTAAENGVFKRDSACSLLHCVVLLVIHCDCGLLYTTIQPTNQASNLLKLRTGYRHQLHQVRIVQSVLLLPSRAFLMYLTLSIHDFRSFWDCICIVHKAHVFDFCSEQLKIFETAFYLIE